MHLLAYSLTFFLRSDDKSAIYFQLEQQFDFGGMHIEN